MSKVPSWDKERESKLISIVGNEKPVTQDTVERAAEELETTTRSVASKLRNMKYEVESVAQAKGKSYTEEEEEEIRAFVESNSGQYTYAEVAGQVLGGSRTAKQIQGKILSMDLYEHIKATEKVEAPKKYTEEEETKLASLVKAGGFIEDIAEKMGREVNSIRGKILSMSRTDDSITIPKQRNYVEKKVDAFEALGDKVADMSVAEIAEAIDKTERGVKVILTHRGVDCADYNGAKRHAKNKEKAASAAA